MNDTEKAAAARNDSWILSLKWVVILGIATVIVVGNYYFADYSLFYRVLVGLALLAVAGIVFYTTEQGKKIFTLMLQSRLEIARVVWPTRPEMLQAFVSVILMVVLVMLLLWGMDSLFAWGASVILG